jgi:HEAT repeat protein
LFSGVDVAGAVLTKHLRETISEVRVGGTLDARTSAAEHLAQLTRNIDPKEVDEKTLADIIFLLGSPEDSVRAWVAASLGNIGPRARAAVPKLISILPLSDCLQVDLSSAPAIRSAVTRIGEIPPPPPRCGTTKK